MTRPEAPGAIPAPPVAGGEVLPRRIPMGGSPNTRDLGGYLTRGRTTTRFGLLFRSGWFDLADPVNARLFGELGIRSVFDFRTAEDRVKKPFEPLELGAELISLPIAKGSMGRYLSSIASMDPATVDCKAAMTDMYREMVDEAQSVFATLFRHLVDADEASLMMCSSGKDRTGVASALLLTALGVPKDIVFQDYMASAGIFAGREEAFARSHGYQERGISPALVRDVMTVHPEYLQAVWRQAEERSGTMEDHIALHIGGGEVGVARLREKFTQTFDEGVGNKPAIPSCGLSAQ